MVLFYRKDKRKFRGAFWDVWALVTMAGFLATLLGIASCIPTQAGIRYHETPVDLDLVCKVPGDETKVEDGPTRVPRPATFTVSLRSSLGLLAVY
ncbi:hypothetical protein ElyMa_005702900 [Elysia marginata]|uniref:Uncharacterized protein n=1 Tax=Elysia marginata TaxID=1093978 RepID=A0AAV4FGB0_9GAST|nr:hypothetical protein ElyMa_005702900 [Elysia marginata]